MIKSTGLVTADTNNPTVQELHGFSFRETTGVADAVLRLRSGSASGTVLFTVSLQASESASLSLTKPIKSSDGVYVQLASGTVEGTLLYT